MVEVVMCSLSFMFLPKELRYVLFHDWQISQVEIDMDPDTFHNIHFFSARYGTGYGVKKSP